MSNVVVRCVDFPCNGKSVYNCIVGPHIRGATSPDSTNHGAYMTVIFTLEKTCVSGPLQFKSVMFNDQLCVLHVKANECKNYINIYPIDFTITPQAF